MKSILEYFKNHYLILDGATGTYLQENGLKTGMCPEQFAIENPDVLKKLQDDYINAGSKAIYTCTLGANRKKLSTFNLDDKTYEINKKLAEITKEVCEGRAYVGGDVGGTGQFLQPLGDFSFEQAVDIFKEQIRGLVDGGVDFIALETMIDVNEARAAIFAAKEICDLPIFVTMTFDESGRTLTASSPKAAAITLQAAGADAVGLNCSTGPKEMKSYVKDMKKVLNVPLIIKPNAGIPQLIDGKTVFDLKADDFCDQMLELVQMGADVVGGCCGTDPNYIEKLANALKDKNPEPIHYRKRSILSSNFEAREISENGRLFVIGERINPTGKEALKEAFKKGDVSLAIEYASAQKKGGADALDINVGVPGIEENDLMKKLVIELGARSSLALSFDSSYPEVVENALRVYPGRALINSISGEKGKADKLMPIAKKYGAMFILLPIGEKGIPKTGEDRIKIIKSLYKKALDFGLKKEDILVDGLAFAISSSQNAGEETFKVVRWCKENGFRTVLGISNSSFGLPKRKWINASYLSAAMMNGLSSAIINPCEELLMNSALAMATVVGRDNKFSDYIAKVSGIEEDKKILEEPVSIHDAVLYGKDPFTLVKKEVKSKSASDIIDDEVIPALNKVGDLFGEKKYFLPQLLSSAGSAKIVFDYLEPFILKSKENRIEKPKVVLATVKGDIHDIGKNLVALMLKNYGFNIIDLGKDVDCDEIVEAVKKSGANIVGLSALMTTTAKEMDKAVKALKDDGVECKIMVGGAVVTKEFADEIGADAYSKDAAEAVKEAKKLID
jgi:5-methyltetrahydrofolate--homocysteine methyltransferase